MNTAQPIRSYGDVQRFKEYYLKKGEYRNYLLVTVCLNTALRICDVLSLKWEDVIDTNTGKIKEHISVTEKKTQKKTVIVINSQIKKALELFMRNTRTNGYIFANKNGEKLSRVRAFYIVRDGGRAIGLENDISCHSLRKTFGYHAWKNGVPAVMLMNIYNHSSFEITKRYLGISQADKDSVYMKIAL